MFKKVISIVTMLLVVLIVWFSRNELVEAIDHIKDMNMWVLALLIPVQCIMFLSAGEIYFSYLRAKGKLKGKTMFSMARLGLEINFVNHVIPSGGVSGLGYMAWRLRRFGVSAGQATLMHILRYALVAIVTTVFILISTVFLAISGVPLPAVLFSAAMGLAMLAFVVVAFIVLRKDAHVHGFCKWISRFINKLVKLVTFGRIPEIVKQKTLDKYFGDLRRDFVELTKDKKLIKGPIVWAAIYALMDSGTFWIAFLALGAGVPIFPVIVAQGMASVVGTVVVTPGGAGFYEAAMIWYFVSTGINPATAIVATLVTRMVVLATTIVTGWGFYQLAISRGEGKRRLALPKEKNGKSNA